MRYVDFLRCIPLNNRPMELENGVPLLYSNEKPAHGYVCANVGSTLNAYVKRTKLGYVASNSCHFVTTLDPDSVRNPDIAFYKSPMSEASVQLEKWPKPELAFEVMSTQNSWSEMNAKAGEYLRAGVKVVCVLDPGEAVLAVYRPDQSPIRLGRDDEFSAPELFPDWKLPVREFLD